MYSGTPKYTFTSGGDFTASGNIYAYSDKNLKENIFKIKEDLFYRLLDIQAYGYNFIGKDDKQFGYIAQELIEYFPNLVSKDKDDIYKVNYIGFIPIISEFLKYLNNKNKALEDRLNKIETMLNNK